MLPRYAVSGVLLAVICLTALVPTDAFADDTRKIYQGLASRLSDDDAKGHYKLGLWCKRHKMPKQATSHFEKVIALSPDHSGARKQLGYIKWKGEWVTRAEKSHRIAMKTYNKRLAGLEPEDAGGHYSLALWCKRSKLFEQARTLFQKVLELNPDHKGAKKQLTRIADTIVGKVVKAYVEADWESRVKVRTKLLSHDRIDAMKVPEVMDLVKREIGKKSRHSGKDLSFVYWKDEKKEHDMKYKLLGNKKGKNMSLLVMLHGGGGPPVNDGAWQSAQNVARMLKPGFDLIAIPRVWWDVSAAWGTRGGTALVREMIMQIRRTYSVDPNRIYLYGYSMGGYGVSCIGCSEADIFAALAVNAAGSDYSGAGENLLNTPITVHIGTDDTQTNRIGKARELRNLVEGFQKLYPQGYKIHFKEYANTGHSLPMSAREDSFDWMAKHTRDPMPRTVIWKGFRNAARKVPRKRYFYWLSTDDLRKDTRIEASIRKGNLIVVKARGVSRFTIFLNEELVDFDRSVKVVVNGKSVFSRKVRHSLSAIVESYAAKEDEKMVFTARIDVGK